MIEFIKKQAFGVIALVGVVVLALVLLSSGDVAGNPVGANNATTTITNPHAFTQGLCAGSTQQFCVSNTGSIGGTLTLTGATSFGGLSTFNAGQLRSYPNSTSTTATAYTLVVGDVLNYDTVLMTPNTGDLTLTFFASSSATTLVPAAGDRQDTCFVNSTTTAGIDITFATGAGIALLAGTSTTPVKDLTISAGEMGCFTFVRDISRTTTFDIIAAFKEYSSAE